MRKYRILAYIALGFFITIAAGSHTMQAREKLDVATIADILKKEDDLNIEEWSVFAREINNEITTKEEFEKKVHVIKNQYPEFHWSMAWKEEKWQAEAFHVTNGVTELIRIMTTEEHNSHVTYIIYEVKGQQWDSKSSSFLELALQQKINYIFEEKPTLFSCVKGSISDNIDSVFANETEKLLNLFKAKEIEGVQEENFSSISAHSSLFTQTIANEKMNVQVGLRRDGLGARTSFVIGTPIITFEY